MRSLRTTTRPALSSGRLAVLAGVTLLTVAAAPSGNDALGLALFGGLAVALPLLGLLPLGLMVRAWRPRLVARIAAAADRRGTASLLIGGGALLALVVLSSVLQKTVGGVVLVPVTLLAVGWFALGFAGCAERLGERLREAPGTASFTIGWLVRSGAAMAPFLWPAVVAYVLATALGAPLVALTDRREAPPTDD